MLHLALYGETPAGDQHYMVVVLVIALLCMWFGRKKRK